MHVQCILDRREAFRNEKASWRRAAEGQCERDRRLMLARYVFSAEIFKALRETPRGKGNEIQLTDAIRQMIQSGAKAIGIQLKPEERRFDVGNLHSYTESFIHFALADPRLRIERSLCAH